VPAEARAEDATVRMPRVVLIDDRDETPDDVPAVVRGAKGPMRDAFVAAGAVGDAVRVRGGGALAFRDVAILARRRATLPLLEFALARLDIPYVVAGRGLFETREVRDIFAVLRLILDPYDRHALATILRGPALGLTDTSLALLSEPGKGLVPPSGWFFPDGGAAARLDEPERARLRHFALRFADLREVCLGLGPADAIRHAIEQLDFDRVIASLPHAAQHLGNIERLLALASQQGGSLPAFVRWLERQIEDQTDESEAAVLSEADDAVTLMTIHASKGLEFSVVVLVDAGTAVRAQPLTMAIAPSRNSGTRLVVRHTRDVGGTLFTPEAAQHHREATAREVAERRRLTYVAMTRAKEHLVVVVPSAEPPGSTASTLRKLLPDAEACCPGTSVEPAVRFLAEHRVADGPAERPRAIESPPSSTHRSLPVMPADAGVVSLSTTPFATFAECPRKYRFVHEMGLEVPVWEGAPRTLRSSSIDQARAAGTAAHRVLERYPLARWGEPVDRSEIERLLSREAIDDSSVRAATATNVVRFLTSRYAARVRESGASIYREEPFVLELGAHRERLLLRGTIDLLVAFPDSSADVLDYKSSGHAGLPGGARDFQLRAYALAARKAFDAKSVRAGIVNLASPAEPAPTVIDDVDHARFESSLLDLRAAFVAARSRDDFHGMAREQCALLQCGFIRCCHG
jgi:ATP-dependent helicase/nuclease subunit A